MIWAFNPRPAIFHLAPWILVRTLYGNTSFHIQFWATNDKWLQVFSGGGLLLLWHGGTFAHIHLAKHMFPIVPAFLRSKRMCWLGSEGCWCAPIPVEFLGQQEFHSTNCLHPWYFSNFSSHVWSCQWHPSVRSILFTSSFYKNLWPREGFSNFDDYLRKNVHFRVPQTSQAINLFVFWLAMQILVAKQCHFLDISTSDHSTWSFGIHATTINLKSRLCSIVVQAIKVWTSCALRKTQLWMAWGRSEWIVWRNSWKWPN